MKICICIGTRPEIIKMAPILRECERRGLDHFLLHTGQHYSHSLGQLLFDQLDIAPPHYHLEPCGPAYGLRFGSMVRAIQDILFKERPDVVLVQGDTDSVLACTLASNSANVPVGHVEAGLRSFDRNMPEEVNRVLTDHASTWLFAPTEVASQNLRSEEVPAERIFVVGNTIADAVLREQPLSKTHHKVLMSLGLQPKQYLLFTTHRSETLQDPRNLDRLVNSLECLASLGMTIVFPLHPNTRQHLSQGDWLERLEHIQLLCLLEPLGYFEFLELEAQAALILTDSGGVQEEACILQVPCVTMRNNTERPETVALGSNMVVGLEPGKVLAGATQQLRSNRKWQHPYGPGHTAKSTLDHLAAALNPGASPCDS